MTHSKVDGSDAVEYNEDVLIIQLRETEIKPDYRTTGQWTGHRMENRKLRNQGTKQKQAPPGNYITVMSLPLTWKQEHEQLEVKVERGPRGGLMLRHRGNDGDVILGIGGIEQRVESAGPRRDF